VETGVRGRRPSIEAFEAARILLQNGEAVAIATVFRTQGSTPREPGARMAVGQDGTVYGTVGGGSGEADVIRAAAESLRRGAAQIVSLEMGGSGETGGMICGGSAEVLVEPLRPGEETGWLDLLLERNHRGDTSFILRRYDSDDPSSIAVLALGERSGSWIWV